MIIFRFIYNVFLACIIVGLIFLFMIFIAYYLNVSDAKGYEYIKLSYKQAVSSYICGVNIYEDDEYIFYFNNRGNRIFVILPFFDTFRFKMFLKRQRKARIKKIRDNNESKEGYNYIISKMELYAKEKELEANNCFEKFKEYNLNNPLHTSSPEPKTHKHLW